MVSNWLFIGVAVLSLILGYTVGVSSSPVASAIIPAMFALVTAAAALALRKNVNSDQIFALSKAFGVFLIVVAMTYLLGTILGANARLGGYLLLEKPDRAAKTFPWDGRDSPDDIRVAIDWLGVQEMLLDKGYTKEQIAELYNMPGSQGFTGTGIYGQTERLSDFLPWGKIPTSPPKPDEKRKTIVDTREIDEGGA